MTLKKQHEWSSGMKNNFKWYKEQINGKWYSVCDHEHVPMIEHTKDDKYKVRNCNGKAILHESFADAEKQQSKLTRSLKSLIRVLRDKYRVSYKLSASM